MMGLSIGGISIGIEIAVGGMKDGTVNRAARAETGKSYLMAQLDLQCEAPRCTC